MLGALSIAIAISLTGVVDGLQISLLASNRHCTASLLSKGIITSAAWNANDDWCIDDDVGEGLGDYVVGHPNIVRRMSENQRKSERRKMNKGNNNDDENADVRSYFATCIPGLHETLASELINLGATHVETNGKSGVRFSGSPRVGLKSLLWCRTAHRIMELMASSSDPLPNLDLDDDFSAGIQNRDDLYQFVRSSIDVPSLLGNGAGGLLTLSVSTIYAGSGPKDLSHSHFTALTVKNALVDAAREMRDDGLRPDVDVGDPDVPLVVVLRGRRVGGDEGRRGVQRGYNNDERYYGGVFDELETVADVDLYRCLHSGGSLHRRGYRVRSGKDDDEGPVHKAAMKETLAAGLLLETGWDKLISAAREDGLGAVLVDPMTGSATLPTEAALIACDIAPGLSRMGGPYHGHHDVGGGDIDTKHRRPPCTRWKGFGDKGEWTDLVADATRRANAGMEWAVRGSRSSSSGNNNVRILCNEKDPRVAVLAETSIRNSGVGDIVSLSVGDCVNWDISGGQQHPATRRRKDDDQEGIVEGRTIFVCNPPWGLRLTDDIDESWVSLREFLRREAGGCESWVLSGNKDLTKILRMKKSRSVVLKTADEDLRWLQYHIFQKSKVSDYQQTK